MTLPKGAPTQRAKKLVPIPQSPSLENGQRLLFRICSIQFEYTLALYLHCQTGKIQKKLNSFDCGIKLPDGHVMPSVMSRPMKGLSKSILQKINLSMGNNVEKESDSITVNYTTSGETRKRCYQSLEKISGVDQRKKKGETVKTLYLVSIFWKVPILCPYHTDIACKVCVKQ